MMLAPVAVAWILTLQSSKSHCHATPVGPALMLTASHCVPSKPEHLCWAGQGQKGTALLVWRDPARDLALLAAPTPPSPPWRTVPIADRPPGNGDVLCWRVYLPEHHSVAACGQALGTDVLGDLDFYGPVEPGSSGSGLVDEAGGLVGVVTSTFNTWTITGGHRRTRERLENLEGATSLLALSSAAPVDRLSWRVEQTVKVTPGTAMEVK